MKQLNLSQIKYENGFDFPNQSLIPTHMNKSFKIKFEM